MSLAATPRPHLWTRMDLQRMVESRILDPEARIELLDGEIVDMPPMGPLHGHAISWANGMLVRAFGAEWVVRVQLDLALDDYNQPVPDFALLTARRMRELTDHPSLVDLVIEVSDSSLSYDRIRKAAAYARAGIPEYWIVNLPQRRLEVHRQPDPASGTWRERLELREDEVCQPLARPETSIRVAELLGAPPDM